jgi:hypothetical protein
LGAVEDREAHTVSVKGGRGWGWRLGEGGALRARLFDGED